mgnify:CR=1 FL=1
MENKKSQLVWDMKIVRRLLKKNPTMEAKYCRYCGKPLAEECECKQPFTIVDVKPMRDKPDSTVAIFENTPELQEAIAEITASFAKPEVTE